MRHVENYSVIFGYVLLTFNWQSQYLLPAIIVLITKQYFLKLFFSLILNFRYEWFE